MSDLIPKCAWCKKIRNEDGDWIEDENPKEEDNYTHSICNECGKKLEAQL